MSPFLSAGLDESQVESDLLLVPADRSVQVLVESSSWFSPGPGSQLRLESLMFFVITKSLLPVQSNEGK